MNSRLHEISDYGNNEGNDYHNTDLEGGGRERELRTPLIDVGGRGRGG